jgi:hypothetical protein
MLTSERIYGCPEEIRRDLERIYQDTFTALFRALLDVAEGRAETTENLSVTLIPFDPKAPAGIGLLTTEDFATAYKADVHAYRFLIHDLAAGWWAVADIRYSGDPGKGSADFWLCAADGCDPPDMNHWSWDQWRVKAFRPASDQKKTVVDMYWTFWRNWRTDGWATLLPWEYNFKHPLLCMLRVKREVP